MAFIGFMTLALLAAAPVPVNSPGAWVSTADYPDEALKNRWDGTVGFRLVVGNDGVPEQCTITSSSGQIALDNRTCEMLMVRAQFRPAGDEGYSGKNTYSNSVRWILPPIRTDIRVASDSPGACGFFVGASEPKRTSVVILQDSMMASNNRLIVVLRNSSWPIKRGEKIDEVIKISAKSRSFWNNAFAEENSLMLFMDPIHVERFADSNPKVASVYRGSTKIGVVDARDFKNKYQEFKECIAARPPEEPRPEAEASE